jgi:hypothetical protein
MNLGHVTTKKEWYRVVMALLHKGYLKLQFMTHMKILMAVLTLTFFFSSCSDVQKDIDAKVAQKSSSNDVSAIAALRLIKNAEVTYIATSGSGEFGTLKQLIDAQLLDAAFGEVKSGYKYEVRLRPPDNKSYEALATPTEYGFKGNRSFYMSEDGVLRGADKKGEEANSADPLVGN